MNNHYVAVSVKMTRDQYERLYQHKQLYPDLTISDLVNRAIAAQLLKDGKAPVSIPVEMFNQLVEVLTWIAYPATDRDTERYRSEVAANLFTWTAEYDCRLSEVER